MKLSELTASINAEQIAGPDVAIRAIAYDSRNVRPGSLFVAIKGGRYDGHNFIAQAVKLGAAAVVVESRQPGLDPRIAQVLVENPRLALARMSGRFYGDPSRKLKLIGITGTNGKTTTSYLLESIFSQAGVKTGLIGTIEYRVDGEKFAAERTTPESLDLQQILATMVDRGVGAAVIEISSHALQLRRVDGCVFAGRIFTNLSQDHLDFHGNLEDYFKAKARLFIDSSFGLGVRLVNTDDVFGKRLAGKVRDLLTFGLKGADYTAANIVSSNSMTTFELLGAEEPLRIRSRLIGRFNLMNLIAAAAAAHELGVSDTDIAAGIWNVEHVPGRFEAVVCGQEFQVLIDYAHTPDGLEKVLAAARLLADHHRLITVFGCGGDRDQGKRPIMGEIAARLSDVAIITSDNPRSEDPEAIIEDIVSGVRLADGSKCEVVVERRAAIKAAIRQAVAGDVVVIAGKGHENYQIIKDKVIPFSDTKTAAAIIRESTGGTN